jgi:hypothetical protein
MPPRANELPRSRAPAVKTDLASEAAKVFREVCAISNSWRSENGTSAIAITRRLCYPPDLTSPQEKPACQTFRQSTNPKVRRPEGIRQVATIIQEIMPTGVSEADSLLSMRSDGLRPQYPTSTSARLIRIYMRKFGIRTRLTALKVVLCPPECSVEAQCGLWIVTCDP